MILDDDLVSFTVIGNAEDAQVYVPDEPSFAILAFVVFKVPCFTVGRIFWFFTSVVFEGVFEVTLNTGFASLSNQIEGLA